MDLIEGLRAIGAQRSDAIDIGRAALLLGALDRPHADLNYYFDHLRAIGDEVFRQKEFALSAQRPAQSLSAQHQALILSRVLADDYGYNGDHLTYDDRRNANLLDVIDRRKGLPVALSILYIHAARAQGWRLEGLNFPGHFIVRLEAGSDAVILDPFNGGRILRGDDLLNLLQQLGGSAVGQVSAEHLQSVSSRDILLRLQNNIKLRFLQSRQPDRAVEILERMRLIDPGSIDLIYELGGLYARTGRLRAAEEALNDCLKQPMDARRAEEIKRTLDSLKRRLN